MLRQQQWSLVVTGTALVLLLAGSPSPLPLEQTEAHAALSAEDVRWDSAFRPRMVSILLNRNPKLGPVTSERIVDAVLRCGRDQRLSPDLVLAVLIVESSARPAARSPKGAIGLMQVMPHMFNELSLPGNVAHIEANIEAGCLILADNIRRLGEDDGISSYFWGRKIRGEGYLRRVRSVLRELALRPEVPARGHG